jgi:hypothetical protein
MKKLMLCICLLTAFSFSAHANLECKGEGKDAKVKMSVLDLATRVVGEGQNNPVAIRIVESIRNARGFQDEALLFAGIVNGSTEDVQWFLESKDKKSLKGIIFMDELYDVNIRVGSRKINFNCEQ